MKYLKHTHTKEDLGDYSTVFTLGKESAWSNSCLLAAVPLLYLTKNIVIFVNTIRYTVSVHLFIVLCLWPQGQILVGEEQFSKNKLMSIYLQSTVKFSTALLWAWVLQQHWCDEFKADCLGQLSSSHSWRLLSTLPLPRLLTLIFNS